MGTAEDLEEAKKWLSLAAKAGHEDAAEILPIMFDDYEVDSASSGVTKILAYPSGTPSAEEIAKQVFFVNHFYALENVSYAKKGKKATVIVNKAPDGHVTSTTFERHLNNVYDDGIVKARDLAIFRSGKLKGTGILTTVFEDDSKSQAFSVWFPALRKIRRHAEPPHDDSWGGSNFTYGDVYLRKPGNESHALLGVEQFDECLGTMALAADEQTRHTRHLPQQQCSHRGKRVYKLKSTTKFENWWYDFRVRYIDVETFADYRAVYYKDDQQVKVLDKDWVSTQGADPRALYWRYWYVRTFRTGQEGMSAAPDGLVKWNRKLKPSLWTEKTLRKIKR